MAGTVGLLLNVAFGVVALLSIMMTISKAKPALETASAHQ